MKSTFADTDEDKLVIAKANYKKTKQATTKNAVKKDKHI